MHKDNKGSTLIEIIVSVLIVGIVFVPLMMSLTTATKSNKIAEDKLYAETVAANCLEAAKAYGIKGFNLLDYAAGDDVTAKGYEEDVFMEDKFASIKAIASGAKVGKYKAGLDGKENAYIIVDITEGKADNKYFATVTFSPEGYAKQNNFENVETVSSLVNSISLNLAKGSGGTAYDSTYFTSFQSDATLKPIENNDYSWLAKKDTVLTIGKINDPTSEDDGKYYVDQSIIYYSKTKNSADQDMYETSILSGNTVDVSGLGTLYVKRETPARKIYATLPKNLILFYTRIFNSGTTGGARNVSAEQNIIIYKYIPDMINVYCIESSECPSTFNVNVTVVGDAANIKHQVEKLKVDAEGNPVFDAEGHQEKELVNEYFTNIYCKHALTGADTYKKLNTIGEDLDSAINKKMYGVEVKVYKDGDDSTPVITKTSSVIE